MTKIIKLTLTCFITFMLSMPLINLFAYDDLGEISPNMFDEEIKLFMGETKSFGASMPKRVAVGNPNVADIAGVTENTVMLVPKAVGTTTFAFTDGLGEHSFRLRVLAEDLKDDLVQINAILKELNYPEVYARLVDTEDKILLKGDVKTERDKEQIFVALGKLKDKIADLIIIKEEETTVDIDVQVLEVNRDSTKTLGFTMPTSISVGEPSNRFSKTMRGSMNAIFHVFDWPRPDFTARLDALVQQGKARILSRPRLACQSGKEAELLVGGEKPILTTSVASAGGEGTEVSYKEYGIKLKVKPTVTEDERIKVALNIDVSDIGTAETLGSESNVKARAYPLTKRSASTELFLDSGQTLGIGGLVKEKEETSVNKTAGLGDIPILGLFFRSKTTKIGGGSGERGNVELIILMTPKIIPLKKKAGLGLRQDEFRNLSYLQNAPLTSSKHDQSISEYANSVKEYILGNFTYPSFARESSLQGAVKLVLHLSSSGELLEVIIKESSGHKVLDDYAVSIVKEIQAYPPFPVAIESKDLFVDVPIVYSLD